MSFQEVQDLSEHLKLLGFPKVFPLQAFSSNIGSLASFHIVAEILQWLADLLEPGTILAGSVINEDERVTLIRSATEFFVTKSGIKLNPRKLYAASAVTAGELQKITRLLTAPTYAEENDVEDDENIRNFNEIDIESLRNARELASELTQKGVILYDLLSKEMVNRDVRLAQANRPMELASVERTLKNAIAATQVKLQSSRAQLENARIEFNALNSKLQRKRAELERTQQRLEALQKIRPAHMQEFEDYEKELKDLFQQYFLRIHVRDALRAQLDARTKRVTPSTSPILQKPPENSIPFMPEDLIDDEDDANDDAPELDGSIRYDKFGLDAEIPDIRDEDIILRRRIKIANDDKLTSTSKRPGTATSRIRPTTGRNRKRITGRQGEHDVPVDSILMRKRDDQDDSTFGSSESDLDMGLIDMSSLGQTPTGGSTLLGNMGGEIGGIGDDDFDLNSMDDISISKITGELPLRPKTANKQEHHSDEDF